MNSRQSEILHLVNKANRIQVSELIEIIGVSGVTIRQDLNFLEQSGYLKRVHGAAISLQNDNIDSRLEVSFDIKQTLAVKRDVSNRMQWKTIESDRKQLEATQPQTGLSRQTFQTRNIEPVTYKKITIKI